MPKPAKLRIVMLIVAMSFALSAQAAELHAQSIDIPAGDLAVALNLLAKQSGADLVYRPEQVQGIRTAGVKGELTAAEAIEKLLEGTQLRMSTDATGAVLIAAPLSVGAEASGEESLSKGIRLSQAEGSTNQNDNKDESGNKDSTEAVKLEEVVVTAQKRVERLRDVPASVTAIRADRLSQMGMLKITEYQALVPGLNINDVTAGGGQNSISLRGVTTGPNGRPTVGIFIDDAPFGGATSAAGVPDIDPADLERIEVLRGPQGTLYGGGNMGGLIKFVTKSPNFDTLSGRVELGGVGVSDGGAGWSARGSINAPITDNLAIRASAFTREDPGYIDNLQTSDDDTNRRKYEGGRISVAARIAEAWAVRLSALQQKIRAEANPIIDVSSATRQPVCAGQPCGQLENRRAPGADNSDNTYGLYDLSVTGDLRWSELVSSTAYSDRDGTSNFDYTPVFGALVSQTFGVPNVGTAVLTTSKPRRISQEIRLSSKSGNALSWQVGGYYTREKFDNAQDVNAFDVVTGDPLAVALPVIYHEHSTTKFREVAGFGNLTYNFTPRFDVTVGGRYSENTISSSSVGAGRFAPAGIVREPSTDDSLTYMVNPRFKLTDDAMVYARVASGYRPGGSNVRAPGVPFSFGPDEAVNYELGVKAEVPGGALSVDAALYYIDWDKIQLNQRSVFGTTYTSNGGKAHSQGAEATIVWRPVDALRVSGNVSYNEAELDNSVAISSVGLVVPGTRLPDTPEWASYLSADYTFPIMSDWTGDIGASWQFVDERVGALEPNPYRLPSYETFDLRAGIHDERLSINLFARNLSDERAYISAFRFGALQQIAVIQPRTFGISVAATF